MRLCPPAGDIVGPGVGDWRRLQIYDDSSSSPATLESSRKLLRRERTSLFACLEIIWRVACCRDRPPATPRLPENRPNETDNLHKEARGRRSVAELSLDDLRRRRSLGDGRENLFPSRCAKPRPPRLSFVTIRYLFISRREENDLIYIYFSWRSRKHSWIFSAWNRFGRSFVEERERNVDRDLGKKQEIP